MSKDYTFRVTLSATVGQPTRASDYNKLVENTKELDQRLEGLMYLGSFLPKAGGMSVTRDGSDRISVITLTTSPVGTITYDYDDGNGGRLNYVEMVLTDPVAVTIRETLSYDGNGRFSGTTRTIS